MKKKCNSCGKCPYFEQSYDYCGECDEWCNVGYNIYRYKCHHTMIVLKLLYIIKKIKDKYYDWVIDRQLEKDLREEYEERVKLGMTEEEYEQYMYDKSINDGTLN